MCGDVSQERPLMLHTVSLPCDDTGIDGSSCCDRLIHDPSADVTRYVCVTDMCITSKLYVTRMRGKVGGDRAGDISWGRGRHTTLPVLTAIPRLLSPHTTTPHDTQAQVS